MLKAECERVLYAIE